MNEDRLHSQNAVVLGFSQHLAKRLAQHALDRYTLLLERSGDGETFRLTDIAFGKVEFPADGSWTTIDRVGGYLAALDAAALGDETMAI